MEASSVSRLGVCPLWKVSQPAAVAGASPNSTRRAMKLRLADPYAIPWLKTVGAVSENASGANGIDVDIRSQPSMRSPESVGLDQMRRQRGGRGHGGLIEPDIQIPAAGQHAQPQLQTARQRRFQREGGSRHAACTPRSAAVR